MSDSPEKKKVLDVVHDFKPKKSTRMYVALTCIVLIGVVGGTILTKDAETAKSILHF